MRDLRSLIREDEHEARMKAACARAQWELGDASWAYLIVGAYMYPTEDAQALAREKGE